MYRRATPTFIHSSVAGIGRLFWRTSNATSQARRALVGFIRPTSSLVAIQFDCEYEMGWKCCRGAELSPNIKLYNFQHDLLKNSYASFVLYILTEKKSNTRVSRYNIEYIIYGPYRH